MENNLLLTTGTTSYYCWLSIELNTNWKTNESLVAISKLQKFVEEESYPLFYSKKSYAECLIIWGNTENAL